MKSLEITIDGLSATGKSAIAKKLSEKLGFKLINSGLFYRSVSYVCYIKKFDFESTNKNIFFEYLNKNLVFKKGCFFYKNENIKNQLYSLNLQTTLLKISINAEWRNYITEKIKSNFKNQNIVAEGRDMSTVVYPKAILKIFLTSDFLIRCERRIKQIEKEKKKKITKIERKKIILKMQERDKLDSTRTVNPLTEDKDSIKIKNNYCAFDEIVEKIYLLFIEKKQ